jgi:hypothetical protein
MTTVLCGAAARPVASITVTSLITSDWDQPRTLNSASRKISDKLKPECPLRTGRSKLFVGWRNIRIFPFPSETAGAPSLRSLQGWVAMLPALLRLVAHRLPPLLHHSSLLFLHHFSQRQINPRLVARPRFLEPRNHISVQTQRNRLFQRLKILQHLPEQNIAALRPGLLRHRAQADRLSPVRPSNLLNSFARFHLR